MPSLSLREILLLVLIVLIFVRGGQLIPNLVRGLGEAIKEFKKSLKK